MNSNDSQEIAFVGKIISKGSYKEAYTLTTDVPSPSKHQLNIHRDKFKDHHINDVICLLLFYEDDDDDDDLANIDTEINTNCSLHDVGLAPQIIYYKKDEIFYHNDTRYKYYLAQKLSNNCLDNDILSCEETSNYFVDSLYKKVFKKMAENNYIYLDNKGAHLFYTLEQGEFEFKLIDFDPQFCYYFQTEYSVICAKFMIVLFLCHYLKYESKSVSNLNNIKESIKMYVYPNINDFVDSMFIIQNRQFAIDNIDKYTIADIYSHYLLYWTIKDWRQFESSEWNKLKIKKMLINEINNIVK